MRSTGSGIRQAVLLATLLTAAMAAPVLLAPRTRLFGLETVGRHHDPFTVIEQVRHGRFSLPYFQPLTDGPAWLIARVAGPVAALNAVTLLSFPLSAAGAYLLARRAFGSHSGALVAALLYAFSPFHVAHAAYHPHVAQTQWLPLYALALWRALEDAAASRLALLAAASLLLGLSSFYSGLIAGVLTIPALAAAGVAARRDERRRRSLWRTTLVLASLGTIAAVAVVASSPEGFVTRHGFPASDAALFSAHAFSYLMPPAHHPLLGGWSRGVWERTGLSESLVEQQVSIGWSVLALAAIAIARRARIRDPARRHVPWAAAIGFLAFVASLPFGAAVLHAVAPTFRAYARFGVAVQLAAAMLAGAGAAVLLRSPSSAPRAWAALLLAVAAFEYAPLPPPPWRDVLPTSAHRWLADHPGPGTVLDCVPRSVPEHSLPALFGRPLAFAEPPLDDCAEPHLAGKLASRGFTHVIVRRRTQAGRWLDRSGPPPGLAVVARLDDALVLAVDPPAPAPLVVDVAGFHEREYEGSRTWRWMGREGRWTITNGAPGPLAASLELDLAAFPTRRRLDILLDGAKVAELDVPTGEKRFIIGPITVPPGESVLAFRPGEAPAVPDRVLANGDPREISIAIGDWHWRDRERD